MAEFLFHVGFKEDGILKDSIDRQFRRVMHSRLGDREDLKEALTPKYRYGCKRITPHDSYLKSEFDLRGHPALSRPHSLMYSSQCS